MKITESAFQAVIVETARLTGWKSVHILPTKLQNGRWRSAQSGDTGFPDLVLAHPQRGVIFAELKTQLGRVTDQQLDWITTLKAAGAEAYIWRPSDWNEIKQILTERKP